MLLIGCAEPAAEQPESGGEADTETSPETETDTGTDAADLDDADDGAEAADAAAPEADDPDSDAPPFGTESRGSYDAPWALEFLPGGEQMLITSRSGELFLRGTAETDASEDLSVAGLPEDIVVDGQGGLGDVVAAPDFEESQRVYLSWINSSEAGTGAWSDTQRWRTPETARSFRTSRSSGNRTLRPPARVTSRTGWRSARTASSSS